MATPKKKTTKKSLSASNELDSELEPILPKAEKLNVDQLFAQAVLRYKNEALADKKIKVKEISHLSLMAEEYLSCFALIGYSLQNEKVVVLSMPTSKDEAALVDLLRATFIELANGRP